MHLLYKSCKTYINVNFCSNFILASNEENGHACMDIHKQTVMPRQLAAGYLTSDIYIFLIGSVITHG